MKNIIVYFELEFDGHTGRATIHKNEVAEIQKELNRLRQQNAELAKALTRFLEDCERASQKPETYDAINWVTFRSARAALAGNPTDQD